MSPEASWPAGRLALGVEYRGSAYHGWQSQEDPRVPSVQGAVESALSRIVDRPVRVVCAGRTDAGVHATYQVVHFDCPVPRPARAWTQGANTLLPDDVSIAWARPVGENFHARHSARFRRYRYLILNRAVRPALGHDTLCWVAAPLDVQRMQAATAPLLGEQDFSAFRAAGCQSSTPMRFVDLFRVSRHGELVVVDLRANAFLHHMVRNLVGSLLPIGRGERAEDWLAELLQGRDRRRAAATAPASGLYLVDVGYDADEGFPRPSSGPCFLPLDADLAYNGVP